MRAFLRIFGALVLCSTVALSQDDGYTDEKRPYEFGFNIDGYQHRYEKKDEKGIIMGEFGFITADGVYHITVYATDENGNFRILKMKNIKIGLPIDATTMTPSPAKAQLVLKGTQGCSGCLIPTDPPTTKLAKSLLRSDRPSSQLAGPSTPTAPRVSLSPLPGQQTNPRAPQNQPLVPDQKIIQLNPTSRLNATSRTNSAPTPNRESTSNGLIPPVHSGKEAPQGKQGLLNQRIGLNKQSSPSPNPLLINEGRGPGYNEMLRLMRAQPSPFSNSIEEGQGLAKDGGMTLGELIGKLYKFNYTLSFHGHHEEGDSAGNKEGGYFVNGRDGISREVKYIANEFGYQPNITLKDLGLNSQDTPKEETEKDLTALKGNEFVWFYNR